MTPELDTFAENEPATPEAGTTEVEPELQVSPEAIEPAKQTDCPDLDSLLYQIEQAPDPVALAEQLQLVLKEDKIQVLFVLSNEDATFLETFEGVELGTQVDTQVQAFVPINQLCELANADEVLAIRLPAEAVPQ